MSIPKPVVAWTHREPFSNRIYPDVLHKIGQPSSWPYCRLLVFEVVAHEAWRTLMRVNLAPTLQSDLVPAHGPDVKALSQHGAHPGNVFLIPLTGRRVYQATPTRGEKPRWLDYVGEIENDVFRLARPNGDVPSPVTEAMLGAALNALPDYLARRPNLLSAGQLRTVVEAALGAQTP